MCENEPIDSDVTIDPLATPAPAAKPRRWGWGLLLLALALAVVVWLGLRWREVGFEWHRFAATFRQLAWVWVAASMIFALATYVGRALRWQVLMRPVRAEASFWNLFSATAIGFTAIVIFGRPGELVRPYLIAVKEKVPFSSQLAAWLLERIFDLLTALLIFGFALSRVRASGVTVGPTLTWVLQVGGQVVAVVCAICLIVLFLLRQFSAGMRRRLLEALSFLPPAALARAEQVVTAFIHGVESTRSHSFVLLLVGYSLLEWALIVACYVCLFKAFPATVGYVPTDVLIFVGFVSFGAVIQIPGIGGGLQIVSVVVLTELFGLSLEVSTGIAIMLWVITFVVIVPVGLLLAFHEGLSWKKIRELEKKAAL